MDARIAYKISKYHKQEGALYTFVSHGIEAILKAIEFSHVGEVNGCPVFNLGFGTYDIINDVIIDNVISNNGDVYRVFNTVLIIAQAFLEDQRDVIIMVRGSDSSESFVVNCKLTCSINCEDECRQRNRRINIYRNFIDKNFNALNAEYGLFGSFSHDDDFLAMEDYVLGKKYLSLFVTKK